MSANSSFFSDFRLLFGREAKRFKAQGAGRKIAYLSFICYFTVFPMILRTTQLYFAIALVSNIGILLVYNIVMVFIYRAKSPFFQQFRIKKTPWPWEVDSEAWKVQLRATLGLVFLNSCVISPFLVIFDLNTADLKFNWSVEDWPSTFTIFWQFGVCLLVEDLLFYQSHRLLHTPQLYWIHKVHHQYSTTVTLAAQYAHPIEFILGNVIPTGLGYQLMAHIYPVHLVTVFLWLCFRIMETCEGHCGYNWSWAASSVLPLSASEDYHNFHHTHSLNNFGSILAIWDTVFGTNRKYLEQYKVASKTVSKKCEAQQET